MKNQYFADVNDYTKHCANFDRELWDHLSNCVENNLRDVSNIEGWLGDVVHYEKQPIDDWDRRKTISNEVISMAGKGQIVFLDPDNGYQVPAHPEGTGRSSKYVYDFEIGGLLEKGAIIVLYQHLRMGQTVDNMIQQFSKRWKSQYRFAVRTSYVVSIRKVRFSRKVAADFGRNSHQPWPDGAELSSLSRSFSN